MSDARPAPAPTVLCAIDVGPGSERALVHVEPVSHPRPGPDGEVWEDVFLPRLRSFVNRNVGADPAVGTRGRRGLGDLLSARGVVRRSPTAVWVVPGWVGVAGRRIAEVAERAEAGLAVMGTHGGIGFGRFRPGSVAEWVLRHAPRAVLTTPVPPSPPVPISSQPPPTRSDVHL